MELYTIGHSTRSYAELATLLRRYGIEILADVRAFPTSTRNPQFVREALLRRLQEDGIDYIWLGKWLGGYRRRGLGARSPNTGWKAEGFRNYADYMMSATFEQGMKKLLELAASKRLAYMCAERFYWRCHRRLISDHLLAKGHKVIHIIDEEKALEHQLPAFAQLIDGTLRYPFSEAPCPKGGTSKPAPPQNFGLDLVF